MVIISQISDSIEELLNAAECNIECALEKKDEYPSVAAVYYKMSVDEMAHVQLLHEQVTALITDYRKTNGDPPERMMGRYDYIHEKQIKQATKIKLMQGLYK